MPEFNSRQITALASVPKVKASPYDHGKVSVLVASTPAVAAWAQNDTFLIGVLPKGSRILRSGKLMHGAFGATVTAHVGVRAAGGGTVIDADGIAVSLDVAAAGIKDLNNGALMAAVDGYVVTADVDVYATLNVANPTDNIQAEFEIHYIAPAAS
jgi:hypothetical protein